MKDFVAQLDKRRREQALRRGDAAGKGDEGGSKRGRVGGRLRGKGGKGGKGDGRVDASLPSGSQQKPLAAGNRRGDQAGQDAQVGPSLERSRQKKLSQDGARLEQQRHGQRGQGLGQVGGQGKVRQSGKMGPRRGGGGMGQVGQVGQVGQKLDSKRKKKALAGGPVYLQPGVMRKGGALLVPGRFYGPDCCLLTGRRQNLHEYAAWEEVPQSGVWKLLLPWPLSMLVGALLWLFRRLSGKSIGVDRVWIQGKFWFDYSGTGRKWLSMLARVLAWAVLVGAVLAALMLGLFVKEMNGEVELIGLWRYAMAVLLGLLLGVLGLWWTWKLRRLVWRSYDGHYVRLLGVHRSVRDLYPQYSYQRMEEQVRLRLERLPKR